MTQIIDDIKKLKSSAKGNRNLELYEDAIADLDAAIQMANKGLREEGATNTKLRDKLLNEIADCHGMKGGVYRRWDNRLDDALAMYRAGLTYEKELGIDSYNLSNVIAYSIIKDGSILPTLQTTLRESVDLVAHQVAELERDPQWWAHADLGMFSLLQGNLEEALKHYGKFLSRGAEDDDFKTTLEVLVAIKDALSKVGDPTTQLVEQAINFLSQLRAGASVEQAKAYLALQSR